MLDLSQTGGDTRSKIFTVAAKLFAEKGYNAVSMREISEMSGMSKPTIYYYFGSKEGIYSDLIETGINQFTKWLDDVAVLDVPVTEKLRRMAKIYFKSAREFPEYTRLFMKLNLSMEKLDFQLHYSKQKFSKNELCTELFQEGVRTGEFRQSLDPDIAAKIYSGVLVHYVLHYLAGDDVEINDELGDKIVDMVVEGMR